MGDRHTCRVPGDLRSLLLISGKYVKNGRGEMLFKCKYVSTAKCVPYRILVQRV
jgi:hypothetical protein